MHRSTVGALAGLLAVPSSIPVAQELEFLREMVPIEAAGSRGIRIFDADEDGDLDAAALGLSGSALYGNDGSGVFAHAPLPGIGSAWDAAHGDLDGDGHQDLYVSVQSDDVVLLGDGAGAFAPLVGAVPSFTSLNLLPDVVALRDLDADGDLDCLRRRADDQVQLLLNDGTAHFSDGSAGVGWYGNDDITDVATGDLDGDGLIDVYVGSKAVHDVLLLATGPATFVPVGSWGQPSYLPETRGVALSDVDLDGDLDVALATQQGRFVFLNSGAAAFVDALYPGTNDTSAVTAGDLDADGDPDLVWALAGSATGLSVAIGDGSGGFAPGAVPLETSSLGLALGDVDGDHDLDLLVAAIPFDRLLLGDGAGGLEPTAPSVAAYPGDPVGASDFDGDGDLDALVGGSNPVQLVNDGSGFLRDAGVTLVSGGTVAAIAVGDLDGDGHDDAWLARGEACGSPPDVVVTNDGSGVLTEQPTALPTTPSIVSDDVALADVDGDGDLDAAAFARPCIPGVPRRFLLLNDGSATFSDGSAALPSNADGSRAVVAGDLDGDGDVDLLIGNWGPSQPQQNRLYANDGTGVFSDGTAQLPALLDRTLDLSLGDVDADGDLDVLVGNDPIYGETCGLLRNDPGGFADASGQLLATSGARFVTLGDVDADGDLDAFLCNGLGCEARANDGAGLFAPDTDLLPPAVLFSGEPLLADFDRDGDADLLVGGSLRMYVNVARQLSWRGVPRLGKPLELELHGPAGGFWVLAYATATTELELPGLGLLRLDPSTLHVLSSGVLDAGGAASFALAVPSTAALLGSVFYWQAMVGVGLTAGLTNLEITALTDL